MERQKKFYSVRETQFKLNCKDLSAAAAAAAAAAVTAAAVTAATVTAAAVTAAAVTAAAAAEVVRQHWQHREHGCPHLFNSFISAKIVNLSYLRFSRDISMISYLKLTSPKFSMHVRGYIRRKNNQRWLHLSEMK